MHPRPLLLALVLATMVLFAACGGDDQPAPAAEAEATPAKAVAEITQVRAALDNAVAALMAGDSAKAADAVAEGYVEHFENVEGPLGKVDAELNEGLEEMLKTEIRQKIEAGAPVAEVQRLVRRAKADLATAERRLQ